MANFPRSDVGLVLPSPSRRHAALRLALAGVAAALADLPALARAPAARSAPGADERLGRTFTAFCDTLVPADALTPAASTLGVPGAILALMQGHALGARLLHAGCAWLDDATAGDFAGAGEAARVAACERMQAMPWDSPPGRFFHVLRNTVMADYYAQPAAWRGLALDRPLQPLGFPEAVR